MDDLEQRFASIRVEADAPEAAVDVDFLRRFLGDAVRELAAGVSFDRMEEIMNALTPLTSEFHNHVQDVIVDAMQPVVENLAVKGIDSKLVKKSGENIEDACKFLTGNVDPLTYEREMLEHRKAKLLERITSIDKENEEMKICIRTKKEKLWEHKNKIGNYCFKNI